MIKMLARYFRHSDGRGSLEGIVNFGQWKEINIIESFSKSVRGNHYHKHVTEIFIILEGRIKVVTQRVKNGKLTGRADEKNVLAGDVFLIRPFINHTFIVKKYSKWINVLSERITSRHPDILRITAGR